MSDSQNYSYIDSTGVIVPDVSDILALVQAEWFGIFGPDLIVTPDTIQGVLIVGEVAARIATIQNNAALANQINPNLAGGIFLDAICALTGLQRTASTPTTVTATLSGIAGTIIPAGTRAQTQANDVFQTTGANIIGGGGTVTASLQSVVFGPIPCEIGALTQIVDGVLGWETVYNSTAAVPGLNQQSDQSLRAQRKITLASQGVALPEAIVSALYQVPGVTSLTFQENTAATTQTINGISMVSHSIYSCVEGGTDTDVATALLKNKSLGAAFVGSTTVNVLEPYSGQTYVVKFDRPTPVPFLVRATVTNTDLLIDATTAVKQAITDYANGLLEGQPGLIVGQDVSSFELAGAINIEFPSIYVSKVETSIDGGTTYLTTPIAIAVNQIAQLGLITVVTS